MEPLYCGHLGEESCIERCPDLEPVLEGMDRMLELGTEVKRTLARERRERSSDIVTLRQTDPSQPYEVNLLSYS